jgi:hypothetical protein
MAFPPITSARFYPDAQEPQVPADVAVVINTVLRPSIVEAIASVYEQNFSGRIQLAIGVDVAVGEYGMLEAALEQRPDHVSALVLTPPYSTSIRHGGIHNPFDGGALRAILSLMCNARHVAYLDDDNLWLPDHVRLLHDAVKDNAWAFSQRMLVDDQTGRDLGVDIWDSVGPDVAGTSPIGDFADPNCLLVNKSRVVTNFAHWAQTLYGNPGYTSDRRFFRAIVKLPHGRVDQATVRYMIRGDNILHRYIESGTNDPETMARIEKEFRADMATRRAKGG